MAVFCLCIVIFIINLLHIEGVQLNCHVYASLRKLHNFVWVSSFNIVLCCLYASEIIVQSSVQSVILRKHVPNTNSYSTSSRDKQLLEKFCLYMHGKKNLPRYGTCVS